MDIAPTVLKFFGVPIPGGSMANRSSNGRVGARGSLARTRARRRNALQRLRSRGQDGPPRLRRAPDAGASAPAERQRRSARCSARRRRWSRRRASCSSSCASSSSSGRSRSKSSRRSTSSSRRRRGRLNDVRGARRVAAQDRRRRSARHRGPPRPSLPARPRRLLAAAPRRRRPALARPRLPHRGGHDAPRSRTHPVAQADARRARRGTPDAAGPLAAARRRSKTQATKARAALDRAVQSRTALVASIDERRDLNAQWTSELEAAQQRLQSSVNGARRRRAALPLRPFQGALPWPVRGAVSSRFGRQPSSRFGTSIVRNGIEVNCAEGTAGQGRARGRRRVCGTVHRLRQPRHRRARRARVLALRPFERDASGAGRAHSVAGPARPFRPATPTAPRRSTSSSASTASRSIPYNGYRKGTP